MKISSRKPSKPFPFTIDDVLIKNTPVETIFTPENKIIYVKREDLSCPPPGPGFSKIRGVYPHILARSRAKTIGVLDTFHSKGGWAVAMCSWLLKKKCVVFYPHYTGDVALRESQYQAKKFGAKCVPLPAGRSAVLYHTAKRILSSKFGRLSFMENDESIYMMPNGLKLPESVDGTAEELFGTPEARTCDSVVVSISTATLGAGVLKGLAKLRDVLPHIYFHFGYTRSTSATARYIQKMSGYERNNWDKIHWIDEGYAYKDRVAHSVHFPCNPYYDLKAYKWMMENLTTIHGEKILFWNIGA